MLTPILHFFDIFEGTEPIQQLVISRAGSGLRIESPEGAPPLARSGRASYRAL